MNQEGSRTMNKKARQERSKWILCVLPLDNKFANANFVKIEACVYLAWSWLNLTQWAFE